MFSQVNTQQVIDGFGVQAGIVILGLVAVIALLYRDNQKKQEKLDGIQEQRITEAKETRDSMKEPFQKQAALTEKIYDLLISERRSR